MMEVKIDALDDFGRGISKGNGKVIFIPDLLPEEVAEVRITKVKKNYMEGVCEKIIKTSSNRVEAMCPYFKKCGGCNLQHMTYEDTLQFKKNKVKHILKKFASLDMDLSITPCDHPYHYRNKVTFKVKNGQIGYYREETHDLLPIKTCPIAEDTINEIIPYLQEFHIKNGEIVLRINSNQEMLISITTQDEVDKSAVEKISPVIKLVGVILNGKTLYGEDHFIERFHHHLFQISYDSFFQVNRNVCDKIFTWIENNLPHCDVLYDLYCGVGTLGIIASKKAKNIYGLEVVPNAVKNAIVNAKLNQVAHAYYLLGEVKDNIMKIQDKPDCILVDPPRAGLDQETIKMLLELEAKTILYMSCDPVTLARDLKILQEKYIVEKCELFDMFPYTYHVESVCVLKKM